MSKFDSNCESLVKKSALCGIGRTLPIQLSKTKPDALLEKELASKREPPLKVTAHSDGRPYLRHKSPCASAAQCRLETRGRAALRRLGTSKAYVIGLAFVAAGFASLPIILAVCALTAVVAYNYIIVCAHFPDGGGVYSAARSQSRFLASVGALLLVANFIVTAALSGWAAASYFGVPVKFIPLTTMGLILMLGIINHFGPKHSGSMSIWLAVPAVFVVITIIAFSAPHLTVTHLEPRHADIGRTWVAFVGVILALSGVEAVANLTGVMKTRSWCDPCGAKSFSNGDESDFASRNRSGARHGVSRLGDAFATEEF